MAYIVKQPTSHGRIIIYLAESQHIPGKRARQIRTYLGSLDVKNNELILKGFEISQDAVCRIYGIFS